MFVAVWVVEAVLPLVLTVMLSAWVLECVAPARGLAVVTGFCGGLVVVLL